MELPSLHKSLFFQVATHYTESIDFPPPPTHRSTYCKETLHTGHKQEVEKQYMAVFRLPTIEHVLVTL